MTFSFITFRSVTYAQRGERVLLTGGIHAVLQRTPRWMEEQGCGYCLRIRNADQQTALQLLRKAGVSFRKVYSGSMEAGLQEVPL